MCFDATEGLKELCVCMNIVVFVVKKISPFWHLVYKKNILLEEVVCNSSKKKVVCFEATKGLS